MKPTTALAILAVLGSALAAPVPDKDCDAPGNVNIPIARAVGAAPMEHKAVGMADSVPVPRPGVEAAGGAFVKSPFKRDNVADIGSVASYIQAISQDCATCNQASNADDGSDAPVKVNIANTGNAQLGDENTVKNLKSGTSPAPSGLPSGPSNQVGTTPSAASGLPSPPGANAPQVSAGKGVTASVPAGSDTVSASVLPLNTVPGSNGVVSASHAPSDVNIAKTPGTEAVVADADNKDSKQGETEATVAVPNVQQAVDGNSKGGAPPMPVPDASGLAGHPVVKLLSLNRPSGAAPSGSALPSGLALPSNVPLPSGLPVHLDVSPSIAQSTALSSSPSAAAPSDAAGANASVSVSSAAPSKAPASSAPPAPSSAAPPASTAPTAAASKRPASSSSASAPLSSPSSPAPSPSASSSSHAAIQKADKQATPNAATSSAAPGLPTDLASKIVHGVLNLALGHQPSGSAAALPSPTGSFVTAPSGIPLGVLPVSSPASSKTAPKQATEAFGQLPAHGAACDGKTHGAADIVDLCFDAAFLKDAPNTWEECPASFQHDIEVTVNTAQSDLTKAVDHYVRIMFSNLTYEDEEAFFGLLDRYFASRPHLLASASTTQAAASIPSPPLSAPTASSGRTLPPRAPSSYSSPPISPPPTAASPTGAKPDLATRLVSSGMKHGSAGLGRLAGNAQVHDALGKVGAAAITKSVNDRFGPPASRGAAEGKQAPPAPPGKKGGVAGLTQSKAFGHMDTSSKMSAFTTMFRDPQKQQPATANTYQPPAFQEKKAALPPPSRRSQAQVEPEPESVGGAEGQAQALYDYEGGDSGDLPVQTGQIVNVLEKTSADWWTCEDGNGRQGLIPANYLKEI